MKEMTTSARLMNEVGKSKSLGAQVNGWLNGRNEVFSMVMEERVSNLQVMHIVHCVVALLATIGMAGTNLFGCVVCAAWFGFSLILANKKGGLR